jgi:hypothetical protein
MKTVKPINPWPWSLKLGSDQAQVVEGHQRQLVCSGQDAVDADGNPQHPGDMAAQLELALDNLEAVAQGCLGLAIRRAFRTFATSPLGSTFRLMWPPCSVGSFLSKACGQQDGEHGAGDRV